MGNVRRTMKRRAFTLIELLTVMAILVVLASILMPAIYAARAAARKGQCASHLHHLGTSLQHYATRNNGWWPERGTTDPLQVSATWKDWFRNDSIDPSLLYCPQVHPNDLADFANTAWQASDPIIDYEILVGSGSISDGVKTALGNRVPVCNMRRMDTSPTMSMLAADLMAKDATITEFDGWVANHRDSFMNQGKGTVLGRNVLYADYSVHWKARVASQTLVYHTNGNLTFYHPDLAN